MDFTKEYVEMCSKAVEIQKRQPIPDSQDSKDWEYASFYYLSEVKDIRLLKWDSDEGHPIVGGYSSNDPNEEKVWLPRQDQLQESLEDTLTFGEQLTRFKNFYRSFYPNFRDDEFKGVRDSWCLFNSWEKIWLAFIMYINYGKVWNGDDWEVRGLRGYEKMQEGE